MQLLMWTKLPVRLAAAADIHTLAVLVGGTQVDLVEEGSPADLEVADIQVGFLGEGIRVVLAEQNPLQMGLLVASRSFP